MSYPSTLVWGTGDPVIYLMMPRESHGGRMASNGSNVIYHVPEKISLEHPKDISIQFIPVRKDGGDVQVILNSGVIHDRTDGFRVKITMGWEFLDEDDFKKILRIQNHLTLGNLRIQPHNDVGVKYNCNVDPEFQNGLTGDLYVGHSAQIGFIGTEILDSIPMMSNAPDYYPIIF